MAGRQVMLWAVVLAVTVAVVTGCTHNNQCDSSCCRVGYGSRYPVPGCAEKGDLGDYCDIGIQPSGPKTLNYPGDATIEVQEAYFGRCPCKPGRVCRCEQAGSGCFIGTCQW